MATAISAPRDALATPDEPAQGGVAICAREPIAGIDAKTDSSEGQEGHETNGGPNLPVMARSLGRAFR